MSSYHFSRRSFHRTVHIFQLLILFLVGAAGDGCAEYFSFNTADGADGTVLEVRWPYWAEHTYNAVFSQRMKSSDNASCYFYGGITFADPTYPASGSPVYILWSFWPPSGSAAGRSVKPVYTAPEMWSPPHVGEGASGKTEGAWPLFQTNRWYRFAFRVWQPTDGTPHLAYVAQWMRDPATGIWYHLATMRIPFAATGNLSTRWVSRRSRQGQPQAAPRRLSQRLLSFAGNPGRRLEDGEPVQALHAPAEGKGNGRPCWKTTRPPSSRPAAVTTTPTTTSVPVDRKSRSRWRTNRRGRHSIRSSSSRVRRTSWTGSWSCSGTFLPQVRRNSPLRSRSSTIRRARALPSPPFSSVSRTSVKKCWPYQPLLHPA